MTIAAFPTTPAPSRRGPIGMASGLWQAIATTYRLGGRTPIVAPALLALVVLPEWVQHVAEIRLGMFTDLAGFRAHAADPVRMAFGVAKIAGMLVAMLAVARYWALGSVRRALMIRPATLLHLIVATAIGFALAWPFAWAGRQGLPIAVNAPLQIVSFVLQMIVMLYLAGVALEDRSLTLRRLVTDLLPAAMVLTVLLALAFGPAQLLHMATHKLALGQPAAVVWALMTLDALLVGVMAALTGAALFVGCRSGLTWRGWTASPAALARTAA
ncbi:hypothetical protein SAMN05192583_2726 [Sphingomonas gellani]|uniref:Uncharacterized protein n=1 Tax=Sphingomonas gellani TaxID=1166340 RepID=A0A1H8G7M4_9SPHN|nr:hypothetical protein [Sphingomonas gellani]SEN39734.1 hypothetical protein SAMN05192583_2726 [Sphingomonas gellani]